MCVATSIENTAILPRHMRGDVAQNTEGETDDRVPDHMLQKLGDSRVVKEILNNPHLVTILQSLDSSNQPERLLNDAMQEPIFLEFASECLSVVLPPSNT